MLQACSPRPLHESIAEMSLMLLARAPRVSAWLCCTWLNGCTVVLCVRASRGTPHHGVETANVCASDCRDAVCLLGCADTEQI